MFSRLRIRLVSVTLAPAFLLANVVLAHAREANVWAERRVARPVQIARVPPVRPATSSGVVPPLDSRLASLAPALGSVQISPADRPSAPVVVHIQDLHRHAEAQRAIGAMIASLSEGDERLLVGLEGAWDDIDLAAFAAFPDRPALLRAADYFFEKGRLSGPVRHAIQSLNGNAAPILVGVDDERLHRAHVEAYRRAAPLVSSVRTALAAWQRELAARKRVVFSRELLAFDAGVDAFRRSERSLARHVRALAAKVPVPPAASAFLAALALEESVDFGRAERERTAFLEKLAHRLPTEELEKLAHRTASFRAGAVRTADFYRSLTDLASAHGVSVSPYPAFAQYGRYQQALERVNPAEVLRDAAALERAAFDRLCATAEERGLVRSARFAHLASRLTAFGLTPEEWEEYALERANVHAPVDLSVFESFYHRAADRDRALVANLLDEMKRRNRTSAVLVAGGFHGPGMERGFARAGIGFASITPRVTTIETEDGRSYLSAFNREKSPLEHLFAGRALFLADAPASRFTLFQTRVLGALIGLAGGTVLADQVVEHFQRLGDWTVVVREANPTAASLAVQGAAPIGAWLMQATFNGSLAVQTFSLISVDPEAALFFVLEKAAMVSGWGALALIALISVVATVVLKGGEEPEEQPGGGSEGGSTEAPIDTVLRAFQRIGDDGRTLARLLRSGAVKDVAQASEWFYRSREYKSAVRQWKLTLGNLPLRCWPILMSDDVVAQILGSELGRSGERVEPRQIESQLGQAGRAVLRLLESGKNKADVKGLARASGRKLTEAQANEGLSELRSVLGGFPVTSKMGKKLQTVRDALFPKEPFESGAIAAALEEAPGSNPDTEAKGGGDKKTHHLPLYLWVPFVNALRREFSENSETFQALVERGVGVARYDRTTNTVVVMEEVLLLLTNVLNQELMKAATERGEKRAPLAVSDVRDYLLAHEDFHRQLTRGKAMLYRLLQDLKEDRFYLAGSDLDGFHALRQAFEANYGLKFRNELGFVEELLVVCATETLLLGQEPRVLVDPSRPREGRKDLPPAVLGLLGNAAASLALPEAAAKKPGLTRRQILQSMSVAALRAALPGPVVLSAESFKQAARLLAGAHPFLLTTEAAVELKDRILTNVMPNVYVAPGMTIVGMPSPQGAVLANELAALPVAEWDLHLPRASLKSLRHTKVPTGREVMATELIRLLEPRGFLEMVESAHAQRGSDEGVKGKDLERAVGRVWELFVKNRPIDDVQKALFLKRALETESWIFRSIVGEVPIVWRGSVPLPVQSSEDAVEGSAPSIASKPEGPYADRYQAIREANAQRNTIEETDLENTRRFFGRNGQLRSRSTRRKNGVFGITEVVMLPDTSTRRRMKDFQAALARRFGSKVLPVPEDKLHLTTQGLESLAIHAGMDDVDLTAPAIASTLHRSAEIPGELSNYQVIGVSWDPEIGIFFELEPLGPDVVADRRAGWDLGAPRPPHVTAAYFAQPFNEKALHALRDFIRAYDRPTVFGEFNVDEVSVVAYEDPAFVSGLQTLQTSRFVDDPWAPSLNDQRRHAYDKTFRAWRENGLDPDAVAHTRELTFREDEGRLVPRDLEEFKVWGVIAGWPFNEAEVTDAMQAMGQKVFGLFTGDTHAETSDQLHLTVINLASVPDRVAELSPETEAEAGEATSEALHETGPLILSRPRLVVTTGGAVFLGWEANRAFDRFREILFPTFQRLVPHRVDYPTLVAHTTLGRVISTDSADFSADRHGQVVAAVDQINEELATSELALVIPEVRLHRIERWYTAGQNILRRVRLEPETADRTEAQADDAPGGLLLWPRRAALRWGVPAPLYDAVIAPVLENAAAVRLASLLTVSLGLDPTIGWLAWSIFVVAHFSNFIGARTVARRNAAWINLGLALLIAVVSLALGWSPLSAEGLSIHVLANLAGRLLAAHDGGGHTIDPDFAPVLSRLNNRGVATMPIERAAALAGDRPVLIPLGSATNATMAGVLELLANLGPRRVRLLVREADYDAYAAVVDALPRVDFAPLPARDIVLSDGRLDLDAFIAYLDQNAAALEGYAAILPPGTGFAPTAGLEWKLNRLRRRLMVIQLVDWLNGFDVMPAAVRERLRGAVLSWFSA